MTTPPQYRTALGEAMDAANRDGTLRLQRCGDCGAVQYPPREVCSACLSGDLDWQQVDGGGELLSHTALHASLEPWFAARAPWPVGLVLLDAGARLVVHLGADAAGAGRVRVHPVEDPSGRAVFVALAEGAAPPTGSFVHIMGKGADG